MGRGPTLRIPTKMIHIRMPHELHATLTALTNATGVAPGRFIVELLSNSEEQLKQLTEAALMAKTAPKAAQKTLNRMVKDARKQVADVAKDVRQMEISA